MTRAASSRECVPRALVRGVVVVSLIAAGLAAPREGAAYWSRPEEIVQASAYTFERGTFAMGVFAPLQYGLTDWLMLSTHPVLHLLVTPNLNVRGRILDWPFTLSVQAGYQQTFLAERDGSFPGTTHGEVIVSRSFAERVILTGLLGYAWNFSPTDHRLQVGGAVHVLLGRADLLMAQVDALYSGSHGEWDWPSGMLFYAHAWHTFHLGVGVAVGRFWFLPSENVSLDIGGVPIYPVVDAWWQL